MKYITLLTTLLLGILSPAAHAVEVANAAADYATAPGYVAGTTAPTAAPAGWEYLTSTANIGGTEIPMPAGVTSAGGNTGFAGASNSHVLGDQNGGAQYEIFTDGFDGNGGAIPTGNEGVVGTDLLIHPGGNAANAYTIVRYTISAADITNGTSAIISGSFRDLCGRPDRGGPSESITAEIFHNTASIFSVTGGSTAQGTSAYLEQATGTFSITGLTVADGDVISFAVGYNGTNAGDETALQASIDLSPASGMDPPMIIVDPASQDLFIGDALSLSVVASGTAPFTYQWRFEGGDIGGATNQTFDIGSLELANDGAYDCVVTNVYGFDTSAAATVTVSVEPPSIVTNPVSQDLIVGETLNLSVVADGTGPLNYQWYKNEVIIPGAESATYTIPSVVLDNAGNYDCEIFTDEDFVISAVAVITVVDNVPPVSSSPDVATNENVSITLGVAELATDADLNTLTITSADANSVGGATITFNGSAIAYIPAPDSTITDDTFDCEVSDGYVTITVTVTVDVLAVASTVVGDPALDYVDATTLPANWTYLGSDLATGGTEFALTASTAIGNGGNTGFGQPSGSFLIPGVLGAIDGGAEFEIFNDSFERHVALEGVDFLLHPGDGAAANDVVIARYTFDGTDITNHGSTATVSGSFRELSGGTGGNGAGSVVAEIYLNGTQLFSATGAAGRLFEADGTFDVPGFTVSAGDTLSFVVGNNSNYGGDETALRAAISLSTETVAGYTSWLSLYPGLTEVLPQDDPEMDGIANGLEYVLNGNPEATDTNILPTVDSSGANFVFSFTRRAESSSDSTQVFQYSSDLSFTDGADISIDSGAPEVSLGTPSGGLQTVTITISKALAVGDKLFGRLSATSN